MNSKPQQQLRLTNLAPVNKQNILTRIANRSSAFHRSEIQAHTPKKASGGSPHPSLEPHRNCHPQLPL
jgi:isochorismate hydrolase